MQSLQRTLQSIGVQLRGLPPTAKLLIGSLMIILVMSLFLVSLYAGRQEMEPLGLRRDVSSAIKAEAINYLQARDIPYQERGDDVLVPSDRKIAVLAQLTENKLIDGDQINFESLVADESPFRTRDQSRQRYLIAKMNVLGGMISQMSGIERARVVIDVPEGAPGLGRSNVASSASVSVQTRGGELSQQQVDAIAHLVARSHAGLRTENVAIIDARTGRSLSARSADALTASRYLEVKQAAEVHAREALAAALTYIPGVLIAVNAQVDTSEVVETSSQYDEPKIGVTNESNRTLSSTISPPAGEAAVRPNTGMTIASMRSESQTSDERSDTASVPAFGKRDSQVRDPRGYPLKINATVGVPRSYFERLMQQGAAPAAGGPDAGGTGSTPAARASDPGAFDALVQAETEKIRDYLAPLIDTQAIQGAVAGTVVVNMIPDFTLAATDHPEITTASTSMLAGGMNGEMVKTIGLGGLAVVSLAMMFMMVRRASIKPALPTAAELVGVPPALAAADSDLVGEADEAAPALEGVELNDDAMRRQQMLEQITSMVHEAPEEAAGLMRKWIKSES
jgi:flagellar biosynthesis/type III secretory pathway M-ring protein FliF/YscJ